MHVLLCTLQEATTQKLNLLMTEKSHLEDEIKMLSTTESDLSKRYHAIGVGGISVQLVIFTILNS